MTITDNLPDCLTRGLRKAFVLPGVTLAQRTGAPGRFPPIDDEAHP